jgi:aminoglycoside phosphotransferase (APT) family kinase protein
MELDDARLAELFDGVEALRGARTITALSGGLTNHNFKVDSAAGSFVVRISDPDTGLLAIDRDNEHVNSVAAAASGVAPAVVAYQPEHAMLVIEYLDGTETMSRETMQAGDYVFHPRGDSILHMRRTDGSPVMRPEDWTRNRPVSAQEVNRLLRGYCRRAGIDDPAVHVHSLRHSANMLYSMAGTSVEDRRRMLQHTSLDMTMRYTHQMQGQKNANWSKAADLLGL